MKFVCIWYDLKNEICRDVVDADNSDDASIKVHLKYHGNDPAPCLAITPVDGYRSGMN